MFIAFYHFNESYNTVFVLGTFSFNVIYLSVNNGQQFIDHIP